MGSSFIRYKFTAFNVLDTSLDQCTDVCPHKTENPIIINVCFLV